MEIKFKPNEHLILALKKHFPGVKFSVREESYKVPNRSSKGFSFEREFCRQLSLWWTQDLPEPREDVLGELP